MDLRRGLVFNKCFCCSKNFNVAQLIELNNNAVVVAEETISMSDLLLDICLISIDPLKKSFICEECKNQLVYFHMFKRDIKKYSSFNDHIHNLEILSKVDEGLKQIEAPSELQVFQFDNMILVSSDVDARTFEQASKAQYPDISEPQQEKMKVELLEPNVVEIDANETEIIEEYIEDSYENDSQDCEMKADSMKYPESIVSDVESANGSRRSKRQVSRKYKYPINTNEKLTEEEKDWINKQVRLCEIRHEGRVVYKCSMCETFLQISGSLKKHLRDCHILKSERDQICWDSRKAFKQEILKSKVVVKTSEGDENIWKCQRCEVNRIFRSEAGLKVHIRYNHIRTQLIDAKFIAQCKIVIDSEYGPKDAWKCRDCSKIVKSRDALRNHMKLEHPHAFDDNGNEGNSTQRVIPDANCNESLADLLERKKRTLKIEPASGSCIDCGVRFINGTSKKEKSGRIHLECHKILNVVSQYYQLPKCDATKTMFSNDDDLNNYLQCDQRYFEPLPCEGMTAKVSRKYKEACGNTARDDPQAWRCGHCGARYQTEFECNAHVMILHSKKLICPVDHMEFEGVRGINHFNNHMHNKHPEMFPDLVIFCTYCHITLPTIFEKLSHMKNCSEKKFECDHCSRKYFTKTELIRHLKIVSGEIAYVCDVCSKTCSSTMDLKLHKTSHTNQKSYLCSYPDCHKAFKTPAARSSHMETHGNTKFPCPSCSSSFRQRALLQRHLRKGHCRERSIKEGQLVFEVYNDSPIYEETHI